MANEDLIKVVRNKIKKSNNVSLQKMLKQLVAEKKRRKQKSRKK